MFLVHTLSTLPTKSCNLDRLFSYASSIVGTRGKVLQDTLCNKARLTQNGNLNRLSQTDAIGIEVGLDDLCAVGQ